MNTEKKIRVMIKKRKLNDLSSNCPVAAAHDWYIICSNGELPEEGFGYATKEDAKMALLAMYDNAIWKYNRGWITI